MIKGRKHVYCGRINWNGKDECICRPHGNNKAMYQFLDVVFDNPVIESIAEKIQFLAKQMGMEIDISFDEDHMNEDGDTVGALIINEWLIIYPEKIPYISILTDKTEYYPGFALDVTTIEYNYPTEPDFMNYSRYLTNRDLNEIMGKALYLIWNAKLENLLEGFAGN